MAQQTEFGGHIARLRADFGTGEYEDIAQVQDITQNITADVIPVNHRDRNKWKGGIPGMMDGGDVPFPVVLDWMQHRKLWQAFIQQRMVGWELDFEDGSGTVHRWEGGITSFTINHELEGLRSANLSVRVNGEIFDFNKFEEN